MGKEEIREQIRQGRTALGIEFGSTRIKAVLVAEDQTPIASGSHGWENRYTDQIWTYTLDDIFSGLRDCYADLARDVRETYGEALTTVGAIGISAMMHGYMAFDEVGELLVPFRTWRNSITGEASDRLTELFAFHIPQRWSIAHLYQAILNGEEHVARISYLTTLAGFIHWKLTGEKVLGIGDAVGMFPVDSDTGDYDADMVRKFDALVADMGYPWKLLSIMPKILVAGEQAGVLTKEGADILDPTGMLQAGIPMCPPEGDAGTGMVATNSVEVRTGNVSAGTSVFAMLVLEHKLKAVHEEIDMVTTPSGEPVAMVHANNCTSDLNAWAGLFQEFADACGMELDTNRLYEILFRKALEGDADGGGLLSYCYLSGENITGFMEGRPLFVRTPDSRFNLANFMRTQLFTALGALKMGMDILLLEEQVKVDRMLGHGGLFKTAGVGQRLMAAAMNAPVSVMETAGEGGAWGIALLASYMKGRTEQESLSHWLSEYVFKEQAGLSVEPREEDVKGFEDFMERYRAGFPVERAAVECLGLKSGQKK